MLSIFVAHISSFWYIAMNFRHLKELGQKRICYTINAMETSSLYFDIINYKDNNKYLNKKDFFLNKSLSDLAYFLWLVNYNITTKKNRTLIDLKLCKLFKSLILSLLILWGEILKLNI